jgi:hypothetical protein
MDLSAVSGINVANETHFNLKAFFILMLVPLSVIIFAVYDTYLANTTVGPANFLMYSFALLLAFITIGLLVFRRAYVGIGILLKAVVDPTEEGALIEVTGRAFKDKKDDIDSLVQEVMTFASGGVIEKKTKIKVPEAVKKEE